MTEAIPGTDLGGYTSIVPEALAKLNDLRIVARIWERDHTVWKPQPVEITNRLGWLDITDTMSKQTSMLESFAADVQRAGFRYIVLLGMGGSSLGAEVLGQTFTKGDTYPRLIVLDSTLPETIQAVVDSIDLARSLFLVSSKSGTTTEPLILYDFFRELLEKKTNKEKVGEHFVAVTDAGTPLVTLAERDAFRHIFLNPPDIGGRYSVLSYFGLVPAALAGVDIIKILDRAESMKQRCGVDISIYQNAGAWLGAAIGMLALDGRDKLTLLTSPSIAAFGLWAEQLIAESTGKEGKGIVPISNEPMMDPDCYGVDRLFVYLRVKDDDNSVQDAAVNRLMTAGQPVIVLELRDTYDTGAEFFRWEFATSVAGSILGIQPFDQPDVQKAKTATAHLLQEFSTSGHLPAPTFTGSPAGLLRHTAQDSYLAIMTYLRQTPETDEAISGIRRKVSEHYKIATTNGYGPRYLHSTGQLYKGGKNTGLFLLLTTDHESDLPVPGKAYSFGTVADAQAIGDFQALQEAGRQVVRVNLSGGKLEGLL